jgi:hypothetical protein
MITGFHWPGTPQDQESQSDMLGIGPNFYVFAGFGRTGSDA